MATLVEKLLAVQRALEYEEGISQKSRGDMNGHSNGHANGHANGKANGHANGKANGKVAEAPVEQSIVDWRLKKSVSDAIERYSQSNGVVADEEALEALYQNSFGCRAGYLPRERLCITEWHRNARSQGKLAGPKSSPAVNKLRQLIYSDQILRMYVTEMIDQVPDEHKVVTDIEQMLHHLATVVVTAPEYHPDPNQCHMFPMWEVFAYMMGTPAGMHVFRDYSFNEALRAILHEWCKFLDSSESAKVLTTDKYGWLSPFAHQDYKLWEYEVDMTKPHGGFTSYNNFFHRAIKPSARPVAEPNNPNVIVSPNDGYVIAAVRDMQPSQRFWLKGERYSLIDILDRSTAPITNEPYVDRFEGGYLFHTYLSGNNYHRFHAPVAGTVEKFVTPPNGLLFSVPEPTGEDLDLGESQVYFTAVNHRKLVFIAADNETIGTVCMMPIGITDISSVRFRDGLKVGDHVQRGEEIGCFAYGGSSIVLLFQHGAIDHFTVPKPLPCGSCPCDGPPIKVNEQIANSPSPGLVTELGAAAMTTSYTNAQTQSPQGLLNLEIA